MSASPLCGLSIVAVPAAAGVAPAACRALLAGLGGLTSFRWHWHLLGWQFG